MTTPRYNAEVSFLSNLEVRAATALFGALSGAALGAFAGPPAMLAGGIIGGIVAGVAAAILDGQQVDAFLHERKLDMETGVIGNEIEAGLPRAARVPAVAMVSGPGWGDR